jgi:hypothetical protein
MGLLKAGAKELMAIKSANGTARSLAAEGMERTFISGPPSI